MKSLLSLFQLLDSEMTALTQISNLLVTFNSSVNFIIYCIYGDKFKRLFCYIFCRMCGGARDENLQMLRRYPNTASTSRLMMTSTRHGRSPPQEPKATNGQMTNGRQRGQSELNSIWDDISSRESSCKRSNMSSFSGFGKTLKVPDQDSQVVVEQRRCSSTNSGRFRGIRCWRSDLLTRSEIGLKPASSRHDLTAKNNGSRNETKCQGSSEQLVADIDRELNAILKIESGSNNNNKQHQVWTDEGSTTTLQNSEQNNRSSKKRRKKCRDKGYYYHYCFGSDTTNEVQLKSNSVPRTAKEKRCRRRLNLGQDHHHHHSRHKQHRKGQLLQLNSTATVDQQLTESKQSKTRNKNVYPNIIIPTTNHVLLWSNQFDDLSSIT